LCSDLVLGSFLGLVDSSSTDCFVDSHFITTHKLSFQEVNLLPLALIDGTINQCVSSIITLYLTLGYSFMCKLYVTRLNKLYSVVLGHNWLKDHNPKINWSKSIVDPPKETPRVTNLPNKDLEEYY